MIYKRKPHRQVRIEAHNTDVNFQRIPRFSRDNMVSSQFQSSQLRSISYLRLRTETENDHQRVNVSLHTCPCLSNHVKPPHGLGGMGRADLSNHSLPRSAHISQSPSRYLQPPRCPLNRFKSRITSFQSLTSHTPHIHLIGNSLQVLLLICSHVRTVWSTSSTSQHRTQHLVT